MSQSAQPASSAPKPPPVKRLNAPKRKDDRRIIMRMHNDDSEPPPESNPLTQSKTFKLTQQAFHMHLAVAPRTVLFARSSRPPLDAPKAVSIHISGLSDLGNANTAQNAIQRIFERLALANIVPLQSACDIHSKLMRTIASQTHRNAPLIGTLGSIGQSLAVVVDLQEPVYVAEAPLNASPYAPAVQYIDIVDCKDTTARGRVRNHHATCMVTPQYRIESKPMWRSAIDSTDQRGLNWRLVFSATWLFESLDFVAAPLLLDLKYYISTLLTNQEWVHLQQRLMTFPLRPFHRDETFNKACTGNSLSFWVYSTLDDPLLDSATTKILMAFLGDPKTICADGKFMGIPMVFYQPDSTDPQQLQHVSLDQLPNFQMKRPVWCLEIERLPRELSTHQVYLLIVFGFSFAPKDILNVFLEYDEFNKAVSTHRQQAPRHVIFVRTATILCTLLSNRQVLVEGIRQLFPNSSAPINLTSRNQTGELAAFPLPPTELQVPILHPIALTATQLQQLSSSDTELPPPNSTIRLSASRPVSSIPLVHAQDSHHTPEDVSEIPNLLPPSTAVTASLDCHSPRHTSPKRQRNTNASDISAHMRHATLNDPPLRSSEVLQTLHRIQQLAFEEDPSLVPQVYAWAATFAARVLSEGRLPLMIPTAPPPGITHPIPSSIHHQPDFPEVDNSMDEQIDDSL